MMASMFISKLIHTVNQCELVITIIVSRMMVDIIEDKMIGFISMGRI